MNDWKTTPPGQGRGKHRKTVGGLAAIVERQGQVWDWYVVRGDLAIRWGECDSLDGAKARAEQALETEAASR